MKRILTLLLACGFACFLLALGIGQEVPVGGVAGNVTLAENGHPMPHALVVLTPRVAGNEYEWTASNWHVKTDGNGSFTIRSIPAGDYTMEVVAREHQLADASVTVTQGRLEQLEVKLEPTDPHLRLYATHQVVAPRVPVDLEVAGFIPSTSEVRLEVRKLRPDALARNGGLRQALEPISYGETDEVARTVVKLSDVVSDQQVPLSSRDAEGAFHEKVSLPGLEEGLYLVVCRGGALKSKVFLNVSNVALVTKSDGKTALCYVTDIDTGKPLAGAELRVAKAGGFDFAARTGPDGLARVPITGGKNRFAVYAQKGNSFGLCDFRTGRGGEGEAETDPNTRIFTYAERPVYRPGDTVRFKAVIRHLEGDELRLPTPGTAKIELFDPDDNLLNVQKLPISSHGTVNGSVSTNPEATPGVYRLEVSANGGVDHYSLNFAAYRKPDYSIKVSPDKPRYSLGDTASATVECQYFFGGPVVGAKIKASIYRSPEWTSFADEEDSNSDDASSGDQGDESSFVGGEYVRDVDVVTDGAGRATVSFPTQPDKEDNTSGSDSALYDYRYSIQASVEDAGGRSFDGSGSVLVTRGDIRLSATTDPFIVAPGERANLTLATSSEEAKNPPAPNREVQVEIGEQTWTRHTVVFQILQRFTVRTGSDGKVVVPLNIAQAENLRIRAQTSDDKGRIVREETSLWVEGGYSEVEGESLKVRLDRRRYDTGDTLKAMITTSDPGGTAFVTIQSDTIKLTRLVPLAGPSTLVRLKVDRPMSPNAFLHVAYVRSRKFEETEREIVVKRPDRRLTVSVRPDSAKTLPGSTVSYRIETRDQTGKGIAAEVSLGVVDESIYTIRRDTTDIEAGLYSSKPNLVETAYSFPEIYLDGGDKAGGSIPVRRKFLDTASWSPIVETDRSGRATVQVRLPDNLTSWRATAVAVSDDTAVGMATSNVRAAKPLMVRLETPQFMVASDRQQISAAITNDSGSDLDVDFRVRSTGLELADASPQRLHVANAQTVSVPLEVTAPRSGNGDLVAEVRSTRGQTDAVEGHFPVVPRGRLIVDRRSGTAGPDTTVSVNLLANRDPATGSLTVTVAPSVVYGLIQSLDSLVQYPYGCVEQTMSRFLPAVEVTHALKGTPLERAELDRRAAKIAPDGFARLGKMQHSDGGWGWWTYDASDPLMTGWVLIGLKRSEAAGYQAPTYLHVAKALDWAQNRLGSPLKADELSGRLFLAYALASYGRTEPAKNALRGMMLAKAGAGELALAALGAQAAGDPQLRDGSLDRMITLLNNDDLRPDEHDPIWDQNEHLSLALFALTEIRPNDELVLRLVTRLLTHRGCDGWESTRATSMAMSGICNYLRRSPETLKPSELTIELNGTELRRIHVDPSQPDVPGLRVDVPIAQLATGENRLRFRASGGSPYYSVELRQYDVEPQLGRIIGGSGLKVERHYYRMEARQMSDGAMKLLPSDRPVSSVKSGDIVRCEITLRCKHAMQFVMVEDPLPSNFRVTDREDPGDDEPWSYWWCDLVIRDDRVSLFARYMEPGEHKLSYMMRAEDPGAANAMPTRAENMYRPEEVSSGDAFTLEVKP